VTNKSSQYSPEVRERAVRSKGVKTTITDQALAYPQDRGTGSLEQSGRTRCGQATLRTSPLRRASSTWCSWPTCSRCGAWAGSCLLSRRQISCWTRHSDAACPSAGIGRVESITAITGCGMCRYVSVGTRHPAAGRSGDRAIGRKRRRLPGQRAGRDDQRVVQSGGDPLPYVEKAAGGRDDHGGLGGLVQPLTTTGLIANISAAKTGKRRPKRPAIGNRSRCRWRRDSHSMVSGVAGARHCLALDAGCEDLTSARSNAAASSSAPRLRLT